MDMQLKNKNKKRIRKKKGKKRRKITNCLLSHKKVHKIKFDVELNLNSIIIVKDK